MANKTAPLSDRDRTALGQSVPLGDTGNGETGVPEDEQGISNRPGDSDEDPDEDFDEDEEDEDEASDPEAEPGKPI